MNKDVQLTIAYTPDSDDAFYYFALETGRVPHARVPAGVPPRADERAQRGAPGTARYQVTAISSVVYPLIADRYAILSVGTSVGRGYGPVLVSRRPSDPGRPARPARRRRRRPDDGLVSAALALPRGGRR